MQSQPDLPDAVLQLCEGTRSRVSPSVHQPRYDRAAVTPGIVHIGVGAFHRAHQGFYIDAMLHAADTKMWGICGVGIREEDAPVIDTLTAQQGLYAISERSGRERVTRLVGAHVACELGPRAPEKVVQMLAIPSTAMVTLTVTEGGYCLDDTDGRLLLGHPDIAHDLQAPAVPRTLYGYLLKAIAARHEQGVPPLTVMSCDNVQHNGALLRQGMLSFAERVAPALVGHIARDVAFPNTMVDRITPATTDADRDVVSADLGVRDAWPVVTEPYKQWIIEDRFADRRPPLERVGAQLTTDVSPYERMKLQLLNAGHSTLGYLGYLAGYRFIHEIMQDADFRALLTRYLDDVTPLLPPVPGVDLGAYKRELCSRFANEAIADQALRICMDGSAKMPKFVLPSVRGQLAAGGPLARLCLVVASWIRFLQGTDEQGNAIALQDPMADTLHAAARAGGTDPRAVLGIAGVFGEDLMLAEPFVEQVESALRALYTRGARATLRAWLAEGGNGA